MPWALPIRTDWIENKTGSSDLVWVFLVIRERYARGPAKECTLLWREDVGALYCITIRFEPRWSLESYSPCHGPNNFYLELLKVFFASWKAQQPRWKSMNARKRSFEVSLLGWMANSASLRCLSTPLQSNKDLSRSLKPDFPYRRSKLRRDPLRSPIERRAAVACQIPSWSDFIEENHMNRAIKMALYSEPFSVTSPSLTIVWYK